MSLEKKVLKHMKESKAGKPKQALQTWQREAVILKKMRVME